MRPNGPPPEVPERDPRLADQSGASLALTPLWRMRHTGSSGNQPPKAEPPNMQQRSISNTPAAQATGTFTVTGQPAAAEQITIGLTIYTWVTALTGPYQVLIGAAATNSLDNLKSAINATAGAGSTYGAGTAPHPLVTATTKTATTLLVQAIGAAASYNSVATTDSVALGSWGAATLTVGLDATDLATLAAAGAVGPSAGFDISTLSGPYNLQVEVTDLHCASGGPPRARIVIEDSIDAFVTRVPVCEMTLEGIVLAQSSVTIGRNQREAAGLRLGVTNARMRAYVVQLDGTTPSITLWASLWN
jgi:hypothetical protein